MKQSFPKCRGNTLVHVAATPQIVLLYKFVCVLRARQRTQNTHKLVLQLEVAAGDPSVQGVLPHGLKSLFHLNKLVEKRQKRLLL